MNAQQQKALLKIASDTVRAVIGKKPLPKFEADAPEMNAQCGCFVTLKNGQQLRGCIGQFVSDKPLVELVAEMAQASATGDPRFFDDPITADELDELDVEISVLSPLKRTNDPLSLRLGVDGIYIKKLKLLFVNYRPNSTSKRDNTTNNFSYCCLVNKTFCN